MKRLTSRHHPLVAACRALARRRDAADPRMLLDGIHLVQEARRAAITRRDRGHRRSVAPRAGGGARWPPRSSSAGAEVVEVSEGVLQAMSPASSPSGIVAIARRPDCVAGRGCCARRAPASSCWSRCDVQDPGNVGAIARAAEAGGASGPGPLRCERRPVRLEGASRLDGSAAPPAGAAVDLDWRATVRLGRERPASRIVATVPRGGASLFEADLSAAVAFLLGGEGPGLPGRTRSTAADVRLTIPMRPPVESLNVAVAAALLVYEAARQRAGGPPVTPRDLFSDDEPAAGRSRRRWPSACGRGRFDEFVGQEDLLGARPPAARGDRARPAAVDHPLGAARHRQDDARAPHRPASRARTSSPSAPCWPGIKEIKAVMAEAEQRAPASSAAARSCSSTRSTASTRRSRTPSCPASRPATSS